MYVVSNGFTVSLTSLAVGSFAKKYHSLDSSNDVIVIACLGIIIENWKAFILLANSFAYLRTDISCFYFTTQDGLVLISLTTPSYMSGPLILSVR